ncbi:MAG: PaaI family thioesterase [Mycobacteriaceae bacterium]|nr:PaaI family thioesterase [Mycobacteriaceae bacterium]
MQPPPVAVTTAPLAPVSPRPCRHSRVSSQLSDLGRGFDTELGLTYLDITPDGARARLQITDRLLQPWGIVHGGVYCAIVESLSSVAGQTWLSEHGGGTVVGVNNNTDFLRSLSSGPVYAASTPIHRGRSTQLWLTTITDDQDRIVARGQVRLQNLTHDSPKNPRSNPTA